MGITEIILLVIIGLAAGLSAGLIGIGGGLFYVLVYSYFLQKFDFASEEEFVRMVIANSILSTFFAALAAVRRHIKNDNFYLKPVLLIGTAGLVFSILFTILISKVEFYNRDVFAVVFTLAVIPLIWKMLSKLKETHTPIDSIAAPKYSLVGLLSGTGTALSGLGGAFIITPLLNGLFGIDIRKVVSISVGVIVIVAGGTSIFNLLTQTFETQLPYTYGGINFLMVFPVVVSVLIAAPFGVKLSQKLSPKVVRLLFLVFCAAIIVRNILELIS